MTHPLLELLARSGATEDFKADVRAYASREPASRVTATRHLPRVKVLRVLTQLLESAPTLPIERVHLDAVAGCSDFRGTLTVETLRETHAFEFVWDCHWRAVREGWTDCFGLPDQIRAAREFGHRCFERWEARGEDASTSDAARRAG